MASPPTTYRATAAEAGFEQTRWHTFCRVRGRGAAQRLSKRFEDLTGRGEQFSAGMSARSRLADVIYRNHPGMPAYLERVERGESPVKEVFPLTEEGLMTRFLALSIGDGRPLERGAFEARFGLSFDDRFAEPLRRLRDHGLVEDDGDSITLTETGSLVYDLVLLAFYPEAVRERIQVRQSCRPES